MISEYESESDAHWAALKESIAERDAKYLALNRELGLATPEGKFTASHAPYAGDDYERCYKAISDWHAPRYRALRDDHETRRRSLGLTLSEFLFLDNFGGAELRVLLSNPKFPTAVRFELIRMKASIMIDRWRNDGNLAYVINQAECDVALFRYAAMRCRAFFGIGLFDLRARAAIRDYKVEWRQTLKKTIFERRL